MRMADFNLERGCPGRSTRQQRRDFETPVSRGSHFGATGEDTRASKRNATGVCLR